MAVINVLKQIQNKTLDSKHEQNNQYTVMRTDNELKEKQLKYTKQTIAINETSHRCTTYLINEKP